MFDKNSSLISNKEIEIIKNYTDKVQDTTENIKGVNDLNITIENVKKNYKNLEKKRDKLYYSNKEKDQMEWVRCMNNIKNRAEETVINELIYV